MEAERAMGRLQVRTRSLVAIITVFAVFIAGAVWSHQLPAANAKPADVEIYLEDTDIPEGGVNAGETIGVTFGWRAPNGVKAGDTMTIEFPATLPAAPVNPFPLRSADGTEGATCAYSGNKLTCTFNDRFERKRNVSGTVSVRGTARATTDTTWDFKVTPDDIVSVPTAGGVGSPGAGGNEPAFIKYGDILDSTDAQAYGGGTVIQWTVTIPWQEMTGPNQDEPVPGKGLQYLKQAVFEDTLATANQEYVALDEWFAIQKTSRANAKRVPFTKQVDGNSATITVTQPQTCSGPAGQDCTNAWIPGNDLTVSYFTRYTGEGFPYTGELFTNNVSYEAPSGKVSRSVDVSYEGSGGATGQGVDHGTFSLTKVLDGNCAEKVADRKYSVSITIDASQSQDPSFTFPRTVDARGVRPGDGIITYTDGVAPGETVKGYDALPAGSKVIISEQLPTIEGVAFTNTLEGGPSAEPQNDGESTVLTIAASAESNVPVTLRNTATCVDPEEPTPPTSEEPTSETSTEPSEPSEEPTTSESTSSEEPEPTESSETAPAEETDPATETGATDPVVPVEPTESEETDPAEPTESTDPAEPTESSEPAEPGESTESSEATSTESTEPAEPTEASDPAEPGEPTEPTETTEEATPTESTETTPTEPGEPTESSDPAEPVESSSETASTPVVPGEPTDPQATDKPAPSEAPEPTEETSPVTSPSSPVVTDEDDPQDPTPSDGQDPTEPVPGGNEDPSDPAPGDDEDPADPAPGDDEDPADPGTSDEDETDATDPSGTNTPGTDDPSGGNGDEGSSDVPWWVTLVVPGVGLIAWLIGSSSGGSGHQPAPAPAPQPALGAHRAPGSGPAPGSGAHPAGGQHGQPGQPGASAPAPGDQRAPINSVPSGATTKTDKVESFIG